jgi:hypothetical protein
MNDTGYYNFLDPVIDSEADILAIRKKALELYREGKTILSWVGEGTEASRAFVAPIESILRETRYALKQKNAAKYGNIVRQSQVIRLG